jgi:HlyD family secretion protein
MLIKQINDIFYCRFHFAGLIGLAIGLVSSSSAVAQPGGMPPAPVVVSKVKSLNQAAMNQAASKSFVGSLVPIRKSTVGSAVDGRVVKLFVDEGDPVAMESTETENAEQLGQPIVQLRTVSLDIEIEAANVELESRKMAESELQQSLPAEIDGAQAAIDEIKARLKYSKENYERLNELFSGGGGVSRREIDEAFSTYRSQSQLIIVAETLFEKLTTTREAKLSQAHLAVEAQEAEIRRLQEQRQEFTIRAPFAGFVTGKKTELGQWLSRGDEVMEIVQLDPIDLVVPVPQTYIQQLQISIDESRSTGKKLLAQVSIESLTEFLEGEVEFLEGEVVQIIPQANLRSRSFPVKIRIKNPSTGTGHLLKPGMLATASMFIGPKEDMLMVTKDALVLGGPEISVYVVREDPVAKKTVAVPVPIKIGASIGNWIQVTGSIQAGDRVVVEGNERLRPNQDVQVTHEKEEPLQATPRDD